MGLSTRLFGKGTLFVATLAVGLALASVPAKAVTYDATQLEHWETTASSPISNSQRNDTAFVLNDNKWLSLGLGGAAVFSFGGLFTGESAVIEVTNGTRSGYPEAADVWVYEGSGPIDWGTYVFADFMSQGWTFVKSITNADATSAFSVLGGPFRYLLIQDKTTMSPGSGVDGFDIDAIGVTVVPLPAGVALLGSGVLALGALGWRKRKQSRAVAA